MERGQRAFRLDNKEDRHTCSIVVLRHKLSVVYLDIIL